MLVFCDAQAANCHYDSYLDVPLQLDCMEGKSISKLQIVIEKKRMGIT
jgi:hypothetical protein